MRFTRLSVLLAPALAAAAGSGTPTTEAVPDCTATASAGFFDLRPDMALAEGDGKNNKGTTADYHARGFDYGRNFTLNICGAVTKSVEDVVGVDEGLWGNVSAHYTFDGDVYSIGTESKALRTRGRKLVLQYTNGSPCGPSRERRAVDEDRVSRRSDDDEKDKDDKKDKEDKKDKDGEDDKKDKDDKKEQEDEETNKGKETRRKSTTISFLCDHDPQNARAAVHFVGTDPDECSYFFEVRTKHACLGGAEPRQPGSIGPGGVFGLIFGIALVVYFAGGVFYQRTVAHARGWEQLPNHTLWLGIWTVISDFATIGASSCARLFQGRRGYSQLSRSPSGWRNREDENRLIDQLDEEWDD